MYKSDSKSILTVNRCQDYCFKNDYSCISAKIYLFHISTIWICGVLLHWLGNFNNQHSGQNNRWHLPQQLSECGSTDCPSDCTDYITPNVSLSVMMVCWHATRRHGLVMIPQPLSQPEHQSSDTAFFSQKKHRTSTKTPNLLISSNLLKLTLCPLQSVHISNFLLHVLMTSILSSMLPISPILPSMFQVSIYFLCSAGSIC